MGEQAPHPRPGEYNPQQILEMFINQALALDARIRSGNGKPWQIIAHPYERNIPYTGTLLHAESFNFPTPESEGEYYLFECLGAGLVDNTDPTYASTAILTFGIRDYEHPHERRRIIQVCGDGSAYWTEVGGEQAGTIFENEPLTSVAANIPEKAALLVAQMDFIQRNPQPDFTS